MGFLRSTEVTELSVREGDLHIPVAIRRNPKAVRLTLRLTPRGDGAVLTAPTRAKIRHLQAFLNDHRAWLIEAFRAVPAAIPFRDGGAVPYRGADMLLRHDPQHRGRGNLSADTLTVGGAPAHFPRRVRDWMKDEARAAITALVTEKTAIAGLKAGRITIRDQVTRWGSCASNGNLAFNWRLICADPHILDYVVAHEVAHLRHMNHSRAFWDLTDSLAEDMTGARRWLRQHGAGLHRIGT